MPFALPLVPGDLTITWADVLGLAPELADKVTATQGTIIINTAADEITMAVWGVQERLDRAALWYCAHLGTGIRLGMWSGALTNVSVGQVSKAFKQNSEGRPFPLDQTKYGMEYARMIKLWMPRFATSA